MGNVAPRVIDRLEDPWEMMIYRAIVRAVQEDRECPTCDDLCDLIGSASVTSSVQIIQRLERKGMIKVRRYQRSRQVYVHALDAWTKEPANKSEPWREQAVTLSALKAERPDEAIEMQIEADRRGVSLAQYLRTCVWAGRAAMERVGL